MPLDEPIDMKKWWDGLLHQINFIKDFGTLIRIIIMIILMAATGFSVYKLYGWAKPKVKAAPTPIWVTSNNGEIHSSTDDNKKKFGLINLW